MTEWNIILQSLGDLARAGLERLPQTLIGLTILVLTWALSGLAARVALGLLTRTKLRRSLQELFGKLLKAAFWVIGIFVAATVVFPTLTPARILTVMGVSSVAVGFAFKDVLENFLAGIFVLLRNVIEIGDVVQCGDTVGSVEQITIRDTHIRTLDGSRVILPNAELFKNSVEVLTDTPARRQSLTCGVAYGSDLAHTREALLAAVRDCSTVEDDPPVEVLAANFGASSIDFDILWWTSPAPLSQRRSRDEVLRAIERALDEADINIPFPQVTLSYKDGVPRAHPMGTAQPTEA